MNIDQAVLDVVSLNKALTRKLSSCSKIILSDLDFIWMMAMASNTFRNIEAISCIQTFFQNNDYKWI